MFISKTWQNPICLLTALDLKIVFFNFFFSGFKSVLSPSSGQYFWFYYKQKLGITHGVFKECRRSSSFSWTLWYCVETGWETWERYISQIWIPCRLLASRFCKMFDNNVNFSVHVDQKRNLKTTKITFVL